MKLRPVLLAVAASLLTGVLVSQAQVPGINSTLQSVFTLAYDQSTMKPTYSSTINGVTPAASATDVCALSGSATKTIKVRRIIVNGFTNGVAVAEPVTILRRSTIYAGAGSSPVETAYDSSNSAATAVAEVWTANPTVGTLVGLLADISVLFPAGTALAPATVFEFGRLGSPVVLRGVAQSVAVNLSGITIAGTLGCTFEWTEDSDAL